LLSKHLIAQAKEFLTKSGSLLQPSSCLANTYNAILDVLKSKHRDDGDALESAGINWLQTRIAVAKNSGKKTIKLTELFAIEPADYDHEIMLFILFHDHHQLVRWQITRLI